LTIGFNERIAGYNTDYAGAMDALTAAMGIRRKQLHSRIAAVIGAGGAARANYRRTDRCRSKNYDI